jgi:hypothetical protein
VLRLSAAGPELCGAVDALLRHVDARFKGKPAVAPPPRWPVTRALLAAAEEVAEMVHLLLSLLHQPPALLKAANGERGLGRGEEAAQGRGGGDWGEEERRGLGRSTRCANAGPGGLLATHG